MSRYPRLSLPAPLGMASAKDPADLPITRARLIRGFTPARNGRLELSKPLQRILQTYDGNPDTSVAYYYNPQPPTQAEFDAGIFRKDRLFVVKNGAQCYIHEVSYDQTALEMSFGDPVFVGELLDVRTGGRIENQNIRTIQYRDEMFIVAGDGSIPMRFYLSPPTDTPFLWKIGIVAPANAPGASSIGAGNVNGDVIYYYTYGDEKDRESSPSPAEPFTASNDEVEVTFNWSTDLQVQSVFIYRTTAGGEIGYRVGTVTNRAVTTFDDNLADADITSNTQMPLIGSNEPPKRASAIELHKDYLMLNNRNIYDDVNDTNSLTQMQVSNLTRPTQYNLVPSNFADDPTLGVQQQIGNKNTDEIVGLRSNGSILAIGTRQGRYHLYGDSPLDFLVRYQHDVGLVSTDSFVEGDGLLFSLGDDGIYMEAFADGFIPRKLSLDIDDVFNGNLQVFQPSSVP